MTNILVFDRIDNETIERAPVSTCNVSYKRTIAFSEKSYF